MVRVIHGRETKPKVLALINPELGVLHLKALLSQAKV
jgi:hypothetical protein